MNFRIDEVSVIAESGSSSCPYFKCRRKIAYLAITIVSLISTKEITITCSTFLAVSIDFSLTATSKDISQNNL